MSKPTDRSDNDRLFLGMLGLWAFKGLLVAIDHCLSGTPDGWSIAMAIFDAVWGLLCLCFGLYHIGGFCRWAFHQVRAALQSKQKAGAV